MRGVDLFSGAGGMSRGAANAGIEIVMAADNWEPAAATYGGTLNHPFKQLDLATPEARNIIASVAPEIIFGGPPCQDFSSSGNRAEGERAGLTVAFAEIIRSARPKFFVMENVPAARKSLAYRDARSIFDQEGYEISALDVDMSYYGIPQRRRRMILVGSHRSLVDADQSASKVLERISLNETVFATTVRQALPGLNLDHYYRHPRSYTRRGVFSIDEPSPTIRGTNRRKPSTYIPHPADTSHDPDIRPLTRLERARIQTFDSTDGWIGSSQDVDQMIANAVPPRLAETVFRAFSTNAPSTPTGSIRRFVVWLSEFHGYSTTKASQVCMALRRLSRTAPNVREYLSLESALNDEKVLIHLKEESNMNRELLELALRRYYEFVVLSSDFE